MAPIMDKSTLDALLKPRSMAVVGVSPRGNVAGRMFRNMVSAGFSGPLYPVNPNYDAIDNYPCFADIASLPEAPDCVAIGVPVSAVFEPLEAAAKRGIKAAVVLAEGFADAATDEGRARQERLQRLAAEYSMAISGPNSMGIIGKKANFAAAFSNLPAGLVTGNVSVVSQSGGLLNAAIELGHNRSIGFNYLISGGNEAVVTSADYIDWLADDPGTSVIVNILEGVRDGRRYRDAIRRASAKKPVVVLKLGRSDAGRRAALAHTGNLAGEQAAYEALFHESTVATADTIDQMIETAAMFSRVSLPQGDRVFVFSVSGGATVLAGDLARSAGLNMTPLSSETSARLQAILEVDHPFQNPMDVVGAPRLSKGDNLTRCLDVLIGDDSYDAIALVMVAQRDVTDNHRVMHEQYAAIAPNAAKPVVLMSEMAWQPAERPDSDAPYMAATLDDGMRALKSLVDYAAHRETGAPIESPAQAASIDLGIAGRDRLSEADSTAILEGLGLEFARWGVADNAANAGRLAADIGFPIALKIVSSDLPHKSESGGIVLDLRGEAQIREAYDRLLETIRKNAPDARIDGVMVQEMIGGGVEMIIGTIMDPQFGPLVMLGAGGTMAELLQDRAVGFAPLSIEQAGAMVSRLKVAPVLDGWRGKPATDRAALCRTLVRLSEIAAGADGQFAAIDLNPVIVLPEGQGVRVVDALIIPAK